MQANLPSRTKIVDLMLKNSGEVAKVMKENMKQARRIFCTTDIWSNKLGICDGNFTQWDNKITTLPGLYLFSVGLLDPTYKMSTGLRYNSNDGDTFLNFCSVKMLRSVNLLMSIINIVLLYTITSHLHGLKVGNEI